MSLVEDIKKVPPVTRFLCGTTMVITLSTMLAVVERRSLVYTKGLVVGRWQIWRVFTSFFHGGTGVGLLMNAYMLFRSVHLLEATTYRERSRDLAWQLILCAIAIFLLSMPFSANLHHEQLVLCLTYLPSMMKPRATFSLFGIIPTREKYLPLILVAVHLWEEEVHWRVSLPLSCTGLLVGHLWFLLEHSRYLQRREMTKFPVLRQLQNGWDRISQPPDWFALYVVGKGVQRGPPGRAPNAPAKPLDSPAWRYDRIPISLS